MFISSHGAWVIEAKDRYHKLQCIQHSLCGATVYGSRIFAGHNRSMTFGRSYQLTYVIMGPYLHTVLRADE